MSGSIKSVPPVPNIPDHTLRRPIGRGAYGEVWLARNVMGTPRAVKIVWRRRFSSERPYERELAGIQSYEPVSRLADGLVHVLHVGRNDAEGCFYYVMELADAVDPSCLETKPGASAPGAGASQPDVTPLSAYEPRTLRSDLSRLGRLPTADCIRLGMEVAGGLAQLHLRGLIHRDVKPANIIYVNGRAKLADIGLVSAGGGERTFVGTEGYIPPEGPGSASSDLYALGIALYEASTGHVPDRFPDVPPEWFRDEAGDEALELHEVILKACEAQKENRYPNIEALQADLALLQSGQSIRRMRGLERRLARLKALGAAAALTTLLAVGWVAFANYRAREAAERRAKESELRTRAEAAERAATERLHGAFLEQARATVMSGEMGRRFRTLDAVRQAAAIRNTPELRREAFAALALPDFAVEREVPLGNGAGEIAVDSGFTRMAVARGEGPVEVVSLQPPGRRWLLEPSTNREAHVLRFSNDGRHLAFKRDHDSGADSDLEVWDLASTQRVIRAMHAVANNAISFHPTEPLLLAGRPAGRLVRWNLTTGREERSWRLSPHWSVAYSPDGGRFAMSRPADKADCLVEIHSAESGATLLSNRFPREVLRVAWNEDGSALAAPCADGSVNVIHARDGSVRALGLHKAQAVDAAFVPGGGFLVSAGWDNEVNVWNLRSHQRELTASLGGRAPMFDRTGRRALLKGRDAGAVFLDFSTATDSSAWDLPDAMSLASRRGEFSRDGQWFVAPTVMGFALWNATGSGEPLFQGGGGLGDVAWISDRAEFVGPDETLLHRWRVRRGAGVNDRPRIERLPVFTPSDRIYSAHWLERRRAFLFTGVDGLRLVSFENLESGSGPHRRASLWVSAVSADESRVAAPYYRSPAVRIFRLPDFAVEHQLTNAAPVRSLAFSPGGGELAVLTRDALCLWETTGWKLTRTLPIETDSFAQVSYSADGAMLLVTETARHGVLRRADTLEPLLPLPLWRLPNALSADGRHLALNVEGRRLQIVDLKSVRARFRELGIDWQP